MTDVAAAALVTPYPTERRPANTAANHVQGPATWAALNIGPWATNPYWVHALANFQKVTGHFTGTTDEIIEWAAHKWGLDEDLIRAVAVQESSWLQSEASDVANGTAHSFGLTQVRDCDASKSTLDHSGWGGQPYTTTSTAVACDIYGAFIRSVYDGAWYDGGQYLYNGRTVGQIASVNSWDYVLWGAVGAWFSGDWYSSAAQGYITGVKAHLTNRDWENL